MCPRSADGERRRETPLERLDRNLEEMTGELRVVVTGVQVLFAFLLIVPFNSGFAHVGAFERAVYFVTLVLAALAAVCTIAPSAGHRFLFRHDDKRYLVFRSNRVVIAGLAFLALAMCGCMLLVATKLFGATAGRAPPASRWLCSWASGSRTARAAESARDGEPRRSRAAEETARRQSLLALTFTTRLLGYLCAHSCWFDSRTSRPNRRKGTKPCGTRTKSLMCACRIPKGR